MSCLYIYGWLAVRMHRHSVFQFHQSCVAWWRHQMETFFRVTGLCAGKSPVTGEFLAQRAVTRSFDVFFHLCMNKRLSNQSRGWFETPLHSLWSHRNRKHILFSDNIEFYEMCMQYPDIKWPRLITVTSLWAGWRLKSPSSRLHAQSIVQAQIKETSKLRVTGLCEGNPPVTVVSLTKGR